MTVLDESEEPFVPTGKKGRVRCTVCGRSGIVGAPWFRECAEGHFFVCHLCPRRFPTALARGAHERFHRKEG